MDPDDIDYLQNRLGRSHARQRMGLERAHEAQVFGYGTNFFHFENSRSVASLITWVLKATGTYRRGLRNAEQVEVRHNPVRSSILPGSFDGFRILHLSDLHVDMNAGVMRRIAELMGPLTYDICVLTGDYRGQTFGPFDKVIEGLEQFALPIDVPIFAVLGNHDSIRMLPLLERIGIRVLLNETETIERKGELIHIAGVDDAHFYRADNIEKVADAIPLERFSILLSHTPEIYRQAAHADFDLMLSGHTHGGQICLPGGYSVTLDAVLPRRYGSGAWRYHTMQGYTSVGAGTSIVPVRFNCAPEITLHTLHRLETPA